MLAKGGGKAISTGFLEILNRIVQFVDYQDIYYIAYSGVHLENIVFLN